MRTIQWYDMRWGKSHQGERHSDHDR
ncbi:MAG: hypothetical protein R3E26_10565 [Nitrosomonas sp.]